MRVRADDQRLDPSLEVAGDVPQRLAPPVAELRRELQDVAAELPNRDLEGRSRAQRRLFEEHRDVGASERPRRRGLVAEAPLGLQL